MTTTPRGEFEAPLPEAPPFQPGRCPACARFGGDVGTCAYCGERIVRGHRPGTAVAVALAAVLLGLWVSRAAPGGLGVLRPARRGLPSAPALAAVPVRGARRPYPNVLRDEFLWLSPAAVPLLLLALAVARIHRRRPELHPWSLVVIVPGLTMAGGTFGTPADRALALAALLAAHLQAVTSAGPTDSRTSSRRWMTAGLGLCLAAPLAAHALRIPAAALAPHRPWVAAVLLAALVFRPPHCPGPVTPGARLRAALRLFGARLILAAVAGLLGWAGAGLAGTPGTAWSPHALTVTLAGLFVLPHPRGRKGTVRPDAEIRWPARTAALTANLWFPSAAPQIAEAALHAAHDAPPRHTVQGLGALVLLAGLALAGSGGWGVSLGGGAWLADAAALPPERTFWLAILAGGTLGFGAAAVLDRGWRRARRARRAASAPRPVARIPLPPGGVPMVAAVVLAAATLGIPGLALLAAARLAGRLPALLAAEPVLGAAFILVPLALGVPGTALPY